MAMSKGNTIDDDGGAHDVARFFEQASNQLSVLHSRLYTMRDSMTALADQIFGVESVKDAHPKSVETPSGDAAQVLAAVGTLNALAVDLEHQIKRFAAL